MKDFRIFLGAIAGLAAAGLAGGAGAAPRLLQAQDLNRLADLSAPAASPDGRWIAYTVATPNVAANKNVSAVWLRAWDGNDARTVGPIAEATAGPTPGTTAVSTAGSTAGPTDGHGAWQATFLPDSSAVAFLSDAGHDHTVQVWVAPLAGGAPRPVTDLPGGVEDYVLAPDGERLVVTAQEPDAPAQVQAQRPADEDSAPIVIDRYLFKDDAHGYLGGKRRHLFVVALRTGQRTQITHGDFDADLPAWSPDGRRIVYVSRHAEGPGHLLGYQLYCIDAAAGGGEVRISRAGLVNNDPDHLSRPAWSPDSRSIAYIQGGAERWLEYAPWELVVADVGSGRIRRVGHADLGYTHPVFTPDGTALLALVEENRNTYLSRIALDGTSIRNLTPGKRFAFDLATGPDGRIVLLSADDGHPYRISVLDGQGERFLPGHNDWLDDLSLQEQQDISVTSSDGTRIDGFLVHPQGYVAGRRYPAIVSLHGGPQYQFSHEFQFDWQLFAARGYAVIGINPRGSSGRGFAFSRAIAADWGHVDVQDVLAATDRVVAMGLADPRRLGVGGWSYGGYLTDYVIASTRRFAAAVAGAGSGNVLAMYGTDQYTAWLELELGKPWKNIDTYLRLSYPFLHSDRITTPTLFLCGQIDFNVPCIGAEQMYQALRSNGVASALVIYPHMHHGPDTPAYALDRVQRYQDWFDRYLMAPGPRP